MYESATEQIATEQQDMKSMKSFRLATVSALFDDNCPKITFFGEETPSEKKYKIIKGTSYIVGDTVLVGIINDGYVILGAVGYSADGGGGGTVYLTEAQANILFATKTHTHTEYALSAHTHNRVQTSGGFTVGISIISGSGYAFDPSQDNSCDLGRSSYRYKTVYAATSTISTSDKKKKRSIEPLDERYMRFFRLLKARRCKFKDGESNRYHATFIAQDVERTLKEVGLTDLDFAGFVKSPRFNKKGKQLKSYDYGLRYEEFIPITSMAVQEVFKIAEKQSEQIEMQSKYIDKLEKRIEKLERSLTSG